MLDKIDWTHWDLCVIGNLFLFLLPDFLVKYECNCRLIVIDNLSINHQNKEKIVSIFVFKSSVRVKNLKRTDLLSQFSSSNIFGIVAFRLSNVNIKWN